MKLRALSLIVVSVAAVAMAQDGVKLRRTFTANTEDVYVCEYSGTQTVEAPTGPMEFKMKGSNNMLIKYKDIKDATCNIDMVTKDMKLEMEGLPDGMGAPGADNLPKEVTASGTMDERNRVTFAKSNTPMDPMTQSLLSSLGSINYGFFVEYPEGAVKVGDTWEITVPKAKEKDADTKLKATLTADKGTNWEVTITGKMPMKIDSAEAAKSQGGAAQGGMQMDFVMNMMMDSTYTILVDKATGKTQTFNGKVDTKMNMELTGMGMTIPGSGTMNITVKLK